MTFSIGTLYHSRLISKNSEQFILDATIYTPLAGHPNMSTNIY